MTNQIQTPDPNFWIFLCFGQSNICVKDTWQVMEDYVRQGKVKSIGVSNFNRHHLDCAPLDCAERADYDSKSQAQPLFREFGDYDVLALRR